MAKIETIVKWLKDPESKKILAPKTLTSCVYDENGNTVETRLNEVFQSVSNGKSLIASTITDKGITTAADATFQTMATNIGKISVSGSAEASNPLSMIGNYNFKSKIVLADELSADNIAITKDSTNIQITSVAKTSDTNFKVTGDFSAISEGDVIKVQTNPGFFFDSNLQSISDVSVIIGDSRFEIAEPTEKLIGSYYSTLIYTQAGANYYAVKANDNTNKYWAIGFITRWSNWYVPVIVSNTADYAHVISTNIGSLSGIYTFEYENKTYYCNNSIQGAYEWTNPINYKAISLYDVADPNFSGINTEAAWTYMAKKLLDFYFGKEEFPGNLKENFNK